MPIEVTAYVPSVAPGVYQAVCTGVETKQAKDGGTFRVWEFTLRDGSGRTINASSSMQTTPKSKAGKWIAGMLGRQPQVGETIEPVGKPCTILVELNDDGYEKVIAVTAPEGGAVASPVKPQVYEGMEQDEDARLKQASDEAVAKLKDQPDDLPF